MSKLDPAEFFKEMQAVLKQFKEELIKEVDGKLENLKREMASSPPSPPTSPPEFPPLPPVGLIKRDIVRVEWKGKMTRNLTEGETQALSKELFDLLQKYGLDVLDAKKIKEQ